MPRKREFRGTATALGTAVKPSKFLSPKEVKAYDHLAHEFRPFLRSVYGTDKLDPETKKLVVKAPASVLANVSPASVAAFTERAPGWDEYYETSQSMRSLFQPLRKGYVGLKGSGLKDYWNRYVTDPGAKAEPITVPLKWNGSMNISTNRLQGGARLGVIQYEFRNALIMHKLFNDPRTRSITDRIAKETETTSPRTLFRSVRNVRAAPTLVPLALVKVEEAPKRKFEWKADAPLPEKTYFSIRDFNLPKSVAREVGQFFYWAESPHARVAFSKREHFFKEWGTRDPDRIMRLFTDRVAHQLGVLHRSGGTFTSFITEDVAVSSLSPNNVSVKGEILDLDTMSLPKTISEGQSEGFRTARIKDVYIAKDLIFLATKRLRAKGGYERRFESIYERYLRGTGFG
jgi:hypothetical protein